MQENQPIRKTPLRAIEVLDNPKLNKGTAFTDEEREQLGLVGLLPDSIEDIDRQLERVLGHLQEKPSDLESYIYLIGLCDRNETLFYKLLMSDPMRFLPIVYDPTVGEACLKFGYIYRRSRGMYVSIRHKGRVAEVLRNWPLKEVRFICVSTGGRILGLGDIGANGMGIPIGKLELYTASAAVPPDCLLPILLDIGTTNDSLRTDPLYLGQRRLPPSENELDEFVDEFVQAVQEVFPGCCIHFEAAGVQFPDVKLGGQTFHAGQANNFYIFPAVGLAVYVTKPKRITDEVFIVAAQASADQVSQEQRDQGMLFPSQANILEVEVAIATRVAEFIFDNGLATTERPTDIRTWIEGQLYNPQY